MGGRLSSKVITLGNGALLWPLPSQLTLKLADSSGYSLDPLVALIWVRFKDLTLYWSLEIPLILADNTPCGPDTLLVLFVCPQCELGTLTDQEEGSGRKSDE